MKKTSRVVAASLAIFALLGLTGCSEVIASAAVIDNDSAVFVLEQSVSPEAMKTLATLPQDELRGISGAPDAENTSIPNLTGVWKQTNGAENEIEINLTTVKVYDTTGDRKKLIWSGSYTAPQYPTRIHDWQSEPDQDNPGLIEKLALPFSYTDGELFYIATDQDGGSKAMFFQQENPPAEEKPVTVPTTSDGPLTQAQLCEYLEASSEKSELAIEGSERQVTCDENGFKAVTSYAITYAFGGITAIGDHELSAQERRDLPFRFGVDPVYKDVVFQHDILGLNDPEVVKNIQDWKKYVTNYSVNVSFPGDVTGFSGEGVQNTPQSVSWDYNAIADSVSNGKYTLSAAGRADYKVNPLPIIMTVIGIIFLLVLIVYFMWKRFTPKVIIVLSYCLAIFGPFGLALALVAREKSRNNADGAFQAAVAIWITSAIFVFEVLVIALLAVLTPQVITEVLAAMGLATSGA